MSQSLVMQLATPEKLSSEICEYNGGRFYLSESGLSFIGLGREGKPLPPRWICSTLLVIAKTRDASSGEWGRLLEWKDDDEVIHQWAMPLALLQGDPCEIRRELARLGLSISPNRAARELLISYLQIVPVEARARCVDRLGWYRDIFVTATEAIGESREKIVFQNSHAMEPALSVAGTVDEWKEAVGQLAVGNSRLVFAISTALAPALAKLLGEDSGGFHFRGASSSGKSTALSVAASVWGQPQAYCRLWRSTSNGLEGLAALHNDGLLILDELSQMDPREAGEAAYLLANGQGKNRASRNGTLRPSLRWRLFFLSAGEESLSALMAKAGLRSNAGQEIRLADIEAYAGAGLGIFETLHGSESPARLALTLKQNTSRYYGAIGREWLHLVVTKRKAVIPYASELMDAFVNQVSCSMLNGQSTRVARRFALVAAAGELATHLGLTGWPKGASLEAAKTCFHAWEEAFGSVGIREDRAIMAQVRAFFESFGASRFDNTNHPNNEKILNRAGFYRTDNQGFRIYMVLTEVYKNELCRGFEQRTVTKTLLQAGWLKAASDGKASHKPRIKGVGTPRLYVFTTKIWGGE